MRTRFFALAATLAFGSLTTACAPPKVLVNHSYATTDKSILTFIQKSGAAVGSGDNKTNLFNLYVRVCNQDAANNTAACKDTVILENVVPDSI